MADPMPDSGSVSTPPARPQPDGLFREPPKPERDFPVVPVAIAAVAVLVAALLLSFWGRRHASPAVERNSLQPTAIYGPHLRLRDLAMSESTSFSGGKETYVDGKLTNTGPATVTGVTVQVLFPREEGGTPQLETVPLNLIRMRQPYVDTEPVSAAPVAPGATADFRLIFDDIQPEWNQQVPEIHVVGVSTR